MKSNLEEDTIDEPSLRQIITDSVKTATDAALKNVRPGSRMEFEASGAEIDLPISHRAGNLSVADKQLLNVLMKGKGYQGELLDAIVNEGIPDSILKTAEERGLRAEKCLMTRLQTKAGLTTTDAGSGLEFMNTTLSSTLLQRLYMESKLVTALAGTEVVMPTNPFPFPLTTTRPTFYLGSAHTAPDESSPGTAGLTLTAQKLIGMVGYDYEAEEDAIVAVLPLVTSQLAEAGAAALEYAMINGDTAGTHQDSDTHALGATHVAKAFNGIRKLTYAQSALRSSWASGGVTTANVGAARKLLQKWGMDPSKLIIVCGPQGYNDLVMLPETLTMEKAGANARIFSGMAPNLLGMDIVPSAAVREDLTAAAIYDGSGAHTYGSMLLLHKPSWIAGVRRGFLFEIYRDVRVQKTYVVASFRRAFAPLESLANTKAAILAHAYAA